MVSRGFGKNRGDVQLGGASGDFEEVWIKGFRAGPNGEMRAYTIRILEEPDTWLKYREHYEASNGYFPCGEDGGYPRCPGCEDDNQRTKNRSYRWAFNALDEKGRLNVFKAPGRLRQVLLGRQQLDDDHTVCNRDVTISRAGNTKDNTVYDVPKQSEVYEIANIPELHDVARILDDKFRSTCESYGITPGPSPLDMDDEPTVKASTPITPPPVTEGDEAQAFVAHATQHKGRIQPSSSPAATAVQERTDPWVAPPGSENTPSPFDAAPEHPVPDNIEDMSTVELRTFLEGKVTVHARAPRARLVEEAKRWVETHPAAG